MVQSYTSWVLKNRWFVIVSTLFLVVAAGFGAKNLKFDSDYRIFFSADNPHLMAFEELQDTYTKTDNVLFVLEPKAGTVFSKETLAMVKELTKASWQLPYSIRVDSLTNFQHTEAEEDDLVVADLVEDAGALTQNQLNKIRQVALNEPLLVGRLVAPEGDVTGVSATIQLPGVDKQKEVPEVAQFARAMAKDFQSRYPDITVHLTGMVMMNNAFPESAKRDMATLVPLMFLAIIVALYLLMRSVTAIGVTFLVIMFSIITTMGLSGWLGFSLSGPTSAVPTIVMTMAVADCVHLFVTYLLLYRNQGISKQNAINESLRINFQPVFLTSLTTAIGFLSMNFSDAPPFRDLGNMVAMGVTAAFIYSVWFLPALASLLPVKKGASHASSTLAMNKLSEFVIKRRSLLFVGVGGLVLGLSAFVPNNELNDEFVKYFDKSMDFRQATDFSSERLTGIYMIDYSLDSGQSNGVAQPEFLANVERFAQWYRQQPEVMNVNTITDTFKRLNKNMHGDDPAYYRLPDNKELAAQYLLLYEMSLPYGLDLNNQLSVDKSRTRLSVTLHNLSSNQILEIEQRANSWLKRNTPASMHVDGSSPTVMFSHIGKRNISSMLLGSFVALVLISLVMIIALRSLRIGLISLIPNLVPMVMAFGLWGMLVGEIGLALSVVAGMTLGIVVDDSVHFLSKYLRARREKDMDSQAAVRYAFSNVGTALVVTSIVLVIGFWILTFSTFKLNSGMGLLTALTIALALFADFFLLPPLLMALDRSPMTRKG
ncbi:MAG: MMPL family transporter [Magnetococcales bacterium]|nr:MMPL family transporter [Magnetococcales bacterium]